MSIEAFEFSKVWTDPTDFRTVEPNEPTVRADIQLLFDEIKTKLNEIISAVNVEQNDYVVGGNVKYLAQQSGVLCYSLDGETYYVSGPTFVGNDHTPHSGHIVMIPEATITDRNIGVKYVLVDGLRGAQGEQGEQGEPGAKGDTGTYYTAVSATLTAAGWSDNTGLFQDDEGVYHSYAINTLTEGYLQVVRVEGITGDDLIIPGPVGSAVEYQTKGVFCAYEHPGYLVFQCGTSKPTNDININIVIFTSSIGLINTAEEGA